MTKPYFNNLFVPDSYVWFLHKYYTSQLWHECLYNTNQLGKAENFLYYNTTPNSVQHIVRLVDSYKIMPDIFRSHHTNKAFKAIIDYIKIDFPPIKEYVFYRHTHGKDEYVAFRQKSGMNQNLTFNILLNIKKQAFYEKILSDCNDSLFSKCEGAKSC